MFVLQAQDPEFFPGTVKKRVPGFIQDLYLKETGQGEEQLMECNRVQLLKVTCLERLRQGCLGGQRYPGQAVAQVGCVGSCKELWATET